MNWISVKDRLPENDNYVLCADFAWLVTDGVESDHYFIGRYQDGAWIANTSETFVTVHAGWSGGTIMSNVNQDEVTHWMPLPEPPSEQPKKRTPKDGGQTLAEIGTKDA